MGDRKKAPSQRQLRVGEELRHAIAGILARDDIRDPDVEGVVITVTEVRASPDLKRATVFITPLGGGDHDAVLQGLKRSARYLRGQVSKQVHLRHTPQFVFELDTSFDTAGHIDELLHRPEVRRDLARGDD
jgi:ribosome-binding factor A